MDKTMFLPSLIVCVITHVIRLVYEILKHKKLLRANSATFVIMFTNMVLLWVSWFLLCANDVYKIELSGFIRYFGISLFGIGLVTFLMGLLTIKTLESYEGNLITKGIYSITRHPMYVGFILWSVGLPIYFGSLFSFILSFVLIANIIFWRFLEEKELEERFSSYADYKKTTLF